MANKNSPGCFTGIRVKEENEGKWFDMIENMFPEHAERHPDLVLKWNGIINALIPHLHSAFQNTLEVDEQGVSIELNLGRIVVKSV